ncbi:MAG: Na/Pi cotransporter family protein [Halomonadaceae bacterium]|nr:MAG: Na/Pi cotransporter family protein [Halomonadaceae bacterium]
MELINLLAGVLLVLFGLRFLRKGFARIMGGDLVDWLQGFTRTRGRSLVGGIAGGVVMPSSTATAMLSVQMTRRGKVSWANVLAVLLGAQLGTTVLIHVLSFNLQSYVGIFVAGGAGLFLFTESSRPRGIGQAMLAFGFMLMGMGLLSQSASDLGAIPSVENLFAALGELPWLFLIGAVVLTMLVQSATASIAVALALVASGQVDLTMLLLWVFGANIGLSLTVLMAGWGETQGQRLGMATLLVKMPLALVAAALLITLPEINLNGLPGALPQQAAWAHTLFNLAAVIAIFFANTLERWVTVLIPAPAITAPVRATRLDPLLLQNPALATNAALRETLQIFDSLHLMLESLMKALESGDLAANSRAEVARRGREIRAVSDEVVIFLDGIPDDSLSEADQALKEAMDDLMREMPFIVRALGPDLRDAIERLLNSGTEPLTASQPLLVEAAARLKQQLNTIARMLMREKPKLGRKVLERKQNNSRWLIQAKRNHVGLPYPAWEMLDGFQELNRRLSGVTYVYCRSELEEKV